MAEKKYAPAFYPPPKGRMRWAERDYVDKAPIFCSTDLRDGNQALAAPMSMADKLGFFQMLVDIGFKEIEVGYPAANDTEFEFVRCLIENNLIPDDVTIQVLTMSREQVIRRTFEALEGAKRAIVHLYIATSPVFRETVLRKSREELLDLALAGAISIRERAGGKACALNFRPSISPPRKRTSRWKCATACWPNGSPPPRVRRSSTCRPQWSFRCRMCTRGRWNICMTTWIFGKMWF